NACLHDGGRLSLVTVDITERDAMRSVADRTMSWRTIAILVFLVIPVLSLLAGAVAWLRYGIDLPFFDDWRAYIQGRSGSFDLSFLFTPENGTYYPIGKVLDAIAQRYLDGNSVAYQFLSMIIVLGSLLALQWRLLSSVMKDRLLAASAFSLTIFMLQPGSYWGHQN